MVDQNKTVSFADFPFDFDTFNPILRKVEFSDRGSENPQNRYSIKNEEEKYCIVSEDEKYALELMDGKKNIDEIAALFMEQKGRIELLMIKKLIMRLWSEGFLDLGDDRGPAPEDYGSNSKRFMLLPLPGTALSKIFAPLIGITLLNPLSVIALILAGCLGSYVVGEIYSKPLSIPPLFTYQNDALKGLIMTLAVIFGASLIRYATLIAAYGGKSVKIVRSGIMMGQVLPGFFVEAPGLTALKAKSRLFVRLSGIMVIFGITGILLGLYQFANFDKQTDILLFQISVYLYIYLLYHMCPILDNDAYVAFADYMDEPYLRKSSFSFVSRHIKKFFSPGKEQQGDNVIYIMFCAAVILWIAFTAQMLLSAISQNAQLLSGMFDKEQGFSSKIAVFITLFPVLCGLLASMILIYKFLVKSISSQDVFKNTRNMIVFSSALLMIFMMLLWLVPPSTRYYFHLLLAGLVFYLITWHATSVSRKLSGSSTSIQKMFLSLAGVIGLYYITCKAFNVNTGSVILIIYTGTILIYSLFNLRHEWSEFIFKRRSSMLIMAVMILLTAGCYFLIEGMNREIEKQASSFTLRDATLKDPHFVNNMRIAICCIIAGCFSLILNIPAIIYRRATQSFAPNFSIVFGSHMIIYFLAMEFFSDSFYKVLESLTGASMLFILGIGALKTALNSRHYITPYPLSKNKDEKETLVAAYSFIIDNITRSITEDFGKYRVGIISRKFNSHAKKVGWDFTLEEHANDDNLNNLGNIYDQSFKVFKELCEEECGKFYVDELISEIDDHFHSTAKEIVNRRINSFTHSQEKKTVLNLTKEKKAEIIKDVILFQEIDDSDKDKLLDCLHSVRYETGDLIIKQHDDGDRMFILAEGKAQVEIEDLSGHSNIVAYLSENEFFGEIALLTSSERTASIRAVEDCTALYLKKKDFDSFLSVDPAKQKKILSILDYLRLLKKIPLFRGMDSSTVNLFASKMVKEQYKKDATIIKQGEEGDKFYIILEGSVDVIVDRDDAQNHKVASLAEGEYFGEIALFKNIPRTATITVATEEAVVLSLLKEHFVKAIESQNSLELNLQNVTHTRIVQMLG